MKKKLTLAVCLFGTMAYAQEGRAGINTFAPKTTLDVNGKKDTSGNLLSTDITGLQAPRLTRAELTSKGNDLYGTDQKGALVYIYDISGGDAVSQRVNVSTIGYYYFDGALWQKMTSGNDLNKLSIPTPALFQLQNLQNDFLNGLASGSSSLVPMKLIKNAIPGLSYKDTRTITFPAGTYQMTFVYEAEHNAPGCTISSYYVDFPIGKTEVKRVYSTASHNVGVSTTNPPNQSKHGGAIIYTTTVPAGRTWTILLGRGHSGNCNGLGMKLYDNSTQLNIFRIGD